MHKYRKLIYKITVALTQKINLKLYWIVIFLKANIYQNENQNNLTLVTILDVWSYDCNIKNQEYYKRNSNDKVVCKLKFEWNIYLEDKTSQDMKLHIYTIHPIGHTLEKCSLNYTFCKVNHRIPMDNLEIIDLGIL